uniref:Protein kinase domain-containing protein n=1 Tax=Clastoptera arizonana TaxID=38151 RepID=A0A1B6E3I6_9HEMI
MVVPESSINNIMGGLESTGGVRLHNHRRKLKQRFDIVKKLGQGTYGKVQLGINKETGQEVAIKTIKKCKIETEADLIRIRREIQIMSSVQHPNIIHIYEVFENREKMVLVMEYAAGGELYDFLSERKVLSEEEARRIFRQIATAVYYCHKHKICHRDLKLENILLDENCNAKIADFGLSNVFDNCRLLSTFCGSPLYASPEIVKGIAYHGPEVDCWSLGVLLYTLVYGAMPFDGSNFKRLVKQISQGDYFEPKKPSAASPLIRDMLNVNPSRRADITAICSHPWIDATLSELCLDIAEELANQTPVRLDLLLSLAPSVTNDKLLIGDQVPAADSTIPGVDRPLRSQSMGNLATASAVPTFTNEVLPNKVDADTNKRKPEDNETVPKKKEKTKVKRERSRSRSKKDELTPEPESVSEKPKRRSIKASKKKSSETLISEEVKEVNEKRVEEEKIIEEDNQKCEPMNTTITTQTKVDQEDFKESKEKTPVSEPSPETAPSKEVINKEKENNKVLKKTPEKSPEKVSEDVPVKPIERRKSKIFETAEKFNNIASKEPVKPLPKKVIIPGVKVSDAKRAYERKSSLVNSSTILKASPSRKSISGDSSASPQEPDKSFMLASTVALNKLVESIEKMSNLDNEEDKQILPEQNSNQETCVEHKKSASPEKIIEIKQEEKEVENKTDLKIEGDDSASKMKNAVNVIGNAITEGPKKAATLPRRKTSRAEIKLAMPTKPPEYRSEVEHMIGNPVVVQRSEVKFPVAAPSPPIPSTPPIRSTLRQGSQPREHIIPIQVEHDVPKSQKTVQQQVSRANSQNLSRQSTLESECGSIPGSGSVSGSVTSMGEAIRKSPREVIIPIAVEGGGYVTPSADTLTRMSSVNDSEDEGMPRGFGLHSSRRHNRQLETTDSVSSDEDDDNFEILTAENLFSTLLSRVRSLTQRLNNDETRPPSFPRLFNHHHSIFDVPASRRLSEARSFSRADNMPWRRSISRDMGNLPRATEVRVRMHAPPQEDSQ